MAWFERYPELKASANFAELNKQLIDLQTEISKRKITHNDLAQKYNAWAKQVPQKWCLPHGLPEEVAYIELSE